MRTGVLGGRCVSRMSIRDASLIPHGCKATTRQTRPAAIGRGQTGSMADHTPDTDALLAAWQDAALAADLAERLAGVADDAARGEGLPREAAAAAAEMAQQAADAAARAADRANEAAIAYQATEQPHGEDLESNIGDPGSG